jgi:pantoate--beta-alanine ligase
MIFVKTINEAREALKGFKAQEKRVGIVPTMGYLHEGHISLVRRSVTDNDITVLTVFVNPVQFGENEDFSCYPRDIDRDMRLAEKAGVDVFFAPEASEMYPDGYSTYVNVEGITEGLCGISRPGHFRGVATVVCKLFNIIGPERAYFGQKDAQQAAVIKRMVKDLNMNVEITVCPIIREKDGLAMSSRNVRLSADERKSASLISRGLFEASKLVKSGEKSSQKVVEHVLSILNADPLNSVEYVQAVDSETLKPVNIISGRVLLAAAVKIGNTRLIDNIILEG